MYLALAIFEFNMSSDSLWTDCERSAGKPSETGANLQKISKCYVMNTHILKAVFVIQFCYLQFQFLAFSPHRCNSVCFISI